MDKTLNPICIGVDVGQISDPTAICVVEIAHVHTGKVRTRPGHPLETDPVMRSEYTIRHITRLPLGTSYPSVSEHIVKMVRSDHFTGREVSTLIDVTGVGRPVYEEIRAEVERDTKHIWLKPITFTGGMKYNRSAGVLAKAYLVSRLQALLQSGRVHGPNTPEMQATLEELRVYEIRISEDGHDTYGAKTGRHDDLATALGLACLEDPFEQQVSYFPALWN